MKDPSDPVATVESPCISVCQVNGDEVCLGCGRTIDEITAWRELSDAEKAQVLELAAERREKIDPR